MDSPTNLFNNSNPLMHTFPPPPCSIELPGLHCQQGPGYSLIHHLLQPPLEQGGGQLGNNMSTQRNQDRNFEEDNRVTEVDEQIEGAPEGMMEDERILGLNKRHGDCAEWNLELLQVKRMKLEGLSRGRDAERGGRSKRREREELKEQLEEARERLQALQEKVWRAFGEKHRAERKHMSRTDLMEDEDIGVYDEKDINGRHSPFNFQNLQEERLKQKGLQAEGVGGRVGLWWDCGGLFRRDWDGEMGNEGQEGGQKFAQVLKLELGSVVARVIDRVLQLYSDTTESAPSKPPAAVSFSIGGREKRVWGGLRGEEERAKELEDKSLGGKTSFAHPTELTVQRSADMHRRHPLHGPRLPTPPHLPMHHPSPLPLPQPPLLPHVSQPKDTSSSVSFPTSSSAPSSSFSIPPMLLPPFPLLHYSMQQLFSRALPHLPPQSRKDFHLNAEPFTEMASHPSFPLPLLEHLEPALSRPGRDKERGGRGEGGMRGGGGLDLGDFYLTAGGSQEGLSPCHLKKAKLMFFYARYPSSNTLKTYFPDVKFNRCVTSQMIKWFSNFREFFYIQMERFARQAVREALTRDGAHVSRDNQLGVGRDTELYRILNMHYNKSNVYQVPERFIEVSEVALREFYAAIWTGRDSDPCWKKGIYKIICKLDSPVPDAFRLPGCPVE